MKPSTPLHPALTLALCAFCFVNSLCADEAPQSSAPQPLPPLIQPVTTNNNTSSSTNQVPAPAPLVRDADDDLDGTWDIEASWRHPLNGDYVGLYRALTTVNFIASSHGWVGFEAGGGLLELRRNSFASEIARDPIELEAAITYRYFFNAPGRFIRPYFNARLGCFVFVWDYRDPLLLEDDVAHTDYVWGIDPSIGLGLNFELMKHLNAFGEAEVGGMVMPTDTTYHHVENNFFDSFGYFGLRAGLRLKF